MQRMTQKRLDEALKRIQAETEKRFPIGCTVRLLRADAHLWPLYENEVGKVVGYARERTAIRVRFRGFKTAKDWSPRLFRKWPALRALNSPRT